MKLSLSRRDKMIVSITLLLLLIGVVFLQFLYLNPLQSDLKLVEQTLKTEQKLLTTVDNKKSAAASAIAKETDSTELQKLLPVKPLQDQFILDLEKAETISNSQIKSMSFQTNGQDQSQSTGNTSTSGTGGQVNSTTTVQQNNSTSSGDNKQTAETSLPVGVQKITAVLNVLSPDYASFEKFISSLESEKRLIVVESIQYTAGSEISSLDQTNAPFTFTLTVSTFYMPALTDLQGQLPKVETPNPGNKDNPLSQSPDITTSESAK
ncbi:MAG: hypothetical protein Q8934_08050 [Bacillota bacterium]|nr:hypothetical protein [Bacillota bacterium]